MNTITINGVICYPAVYKGVPCPKYAVSEDGDIYSVKSGRKLALYPPGNNYKEITLSDINNNRVPASVHQLVFESINGYNPIDRDGMEIDHINGDKTDNRISNLRAIEHKSNVRKSFESGKSKRFDRTISDEVARDICELLSRGVIPNEISRMRGYSLNWINGILQRDYCTEISKEYVWNLPSKAGISIPDSVIHGICQDLSDGKLGIRKIARKWNVGHTTVASIRDGKTRTDITSQYDMSGLTDEQKLNLQTGERVEQYYTKDGKPTNVLVTSMGRFFRTGSLKELNPSMQHNDPSIVIRIDDGPKRSMPCKKIVAETFVDNPNGYKDIIYKDGNKFNLKPTNLRYVSHEAACRATGMYDTRRTYDGGDNPNATLASDDIDAVLIMHYELGICYKSIAHQYNISKEAIKNICNGASWVANYNEYMANRFRNIQKYNDDLVLKF